MATKGDYRRDKWDAVWCYDGEKWQMVTNHSGSPISYFDPENAFQQIGIKKFEPEEDPSGDDSPYLYPTLKRIEAKLDALVTI